MKGFAVHLAILSFVGQKREFVEHLNGLQSRQMANGYGTERLGISSLVKRRLTKKIFDRYQKPAPIE
jgi:hypothetical protein